MDWQNFPPGQQFSPTYDPNHPQMDFTNLQFPPPQYQPPPFQDMSIFQGYDPTSPAGAPALPAWSGYFATGAPNPAAMANFQSASFNHLAPPTPNASYHTQNHNSGNLSQPNTKKGANKQKKATQGGRNSNHITAKGFVNGKMQAQDNRPNKKAKTGSQQHQKQSGAIGESLNQSMQRVGSSKSSRNRQATKAAKTGALDAQNTSTSSKPKSPAPASMASANVHSDVAQASQDLANERERAKQFLLVMHANHVGFEDLLREGLDAHFLQQLYAEIGVEVPACTKSASAQDHQQHNDGDDLDDDLYEPTDEPIAIFDAAPTVGAAPLAATKPTVPMLEVPAWPSSSHNLPTPSNREDYLARLKALKAGHSVPAIQLSQPPGLSALSTNMDLQTPSSEAYNELTTASASEANGITPIVNTNQEDLARARDKARRAFAASRAARKAQMSAASSLPIEPSANSKDSDQSALQQHDREQGVAKQADAEHGQSSSAPGKAGDGSVSDHATSGPGPQVTATTESVRLPGLSDTATAPSPEQNLLAQLKHSPITTARRDLDVNASHSDGVVSQSQMKFSTLSAEREATPDPRATSMVKSAAPLEAGNAEDYIRFAESDDFSFPGFQRSAEPDIPGLTAISRHRPHSTASNRPALQHSSSYQNDRLQGHMSRIDEMKRIIELRELKKKVKTRRTGTPETPQALPRIASASSAQTIEDGTGLKPETHEYSLSEAETKAIQQDNSPQQVVGTQASAASPFTQSQPVQATTLTEEDRAVLPNPASGKVHNVPSSLRSSDFASPPRGVHSTWKTQRRAELESFLDERTAQTASDAQRLAALQAEMQELQSKVRKEQEAKVQLVQELESLGVDTQHIPENQLQDARDEVVASLTMAHARSDAVSGISPQRDSSANQMLDTPEEVQQDVLVGSQLISDRKTEGSSVSHGEGQDVQILENDNMDVQASDDDAQSMQASDAEGINLDASDDEGEKTQPADDQDINLEASDNGDRDMEDFDDHSGDLKDLNNDVQDIEAVENGAQSERPDSSYTQGSHSPRSTSNVELVGADDPRDDEAEQDVMDTDTSSEGEIEEEDPVNADATFEGFDDSQIQPSSTAANEPIIAFDDNTMDDSDRISQHEDGYRSVGELSNALDVEDSLASQEDEVALMDQSSDEGEYSPEPSMSNIPSQPVIAQRTFSISSSSSSEASEDYEPPQPEAQPRVSEPDPSESEEEDYEPPDAANQALGKTAPLVDTAPDTAPDQPSDPDDLYDEASAQEDAISAADDDFNVEPGHLSTPELP